MTLIFDFNGTLLNDVDECFSLLNYLLGLRNHPSISFDKYRKIFKFPIIEYYADAGFIFPDDNYEELSKIFIEEYSKMPLKLFDGVYETLEYLKQKGYKLVVLSSSERKILIKQLKELKIFNFFDCILGNDNIMGNSKISNGVKYRNSHKNENITVIGDTDHDLEASKAIDAKCILVSYGHQNRIEKNIKIINSFKELRKLF